MITAIQRIYTQHYSLVIFGTSLAGLGSQCKSLSTSIPGGTTSSLSSVNDMYPHSAISVSPFRMA